MPLTRAYSAAPNAPISCGSMARSITSICNTFYDEGELASFGLRSVYSGNVGRDYLYTTPGYISFNSLGLRPVVSFNINRIDISDTTKTGAETAPWEIK